MPHGHTLLAAREDASPRSVRILGRGLISTGDGLYMGNHTPYMSAQVERRRCPLTARREASPRHSSPQSVTEAGNERSTCLVIRDTQGTLPLPPRPCSLCTTRRWAAAPYTHSSIGGGGGSCPWSAELMAITAKIEQPMGHRCSIDKGSCWLRRRLSV